MMAGRKSAELISRILRAFATETTWRQSDLARHCGISVKALRPHLQGLKRQGVLPLTSEVEHPHVVWSVPNGCFPGGAALDHDDIAMVARFIARNPTSADRERLLRRLLRFADGPVVRNERPALAEEITRALEDSVLLRRTVRIRYHSAHRGELHDEILSVHSVEHGDRLRFVATPNGGEMRWFRGDGVERIGLTDEPYQPADDAALRRFIDASVDGFHAGGAPAPYEFFVRLPEARWVARNLPRPLRVTSVEGGALARGETAALKVIAAYVVGLGDAARALSEDLRREVVQLARGAIRVNERALRKGHARSVGSKRATG